MVYAGKTDRLHQEMCARLADTLTCYQCRMLTCGDATVTLYLYSGSVKSILYSSGVRLPSGAFWDLIVITAKLGLYISSDCNTSNLYCKKNYGKQLEHKR